MRSSEFRSVVRDGFYGLRPFDPCYLHFLNKIFYFVLVLARFECCKLVHPYLNMLRTLVLLTNYILYKSYRISQLIRGPFDMSIWWRTGTRPTAPDPWPNDDFVFFGKHPGLDLFLSQLLIYLQVVESALKVHQSMSKVFGTVSEPPFYISAQNDATVEIGPDVYESRFPKNLKKNFKFSSKNLHKKSN